MMARGIVRWYSLEKGFGIIIPDDGGRDLHFQSENVDTPDHYVAEHQRVEYEFSLGRKGPEAIHVRPA